MTKTETATVVINRRTLRIGGQVYPLLNISRVQTIRFMPAKKRPVWRFFKGAVGLAVLAAILVLISTRALPDQPSLPGVILTAAGLWIALLFVIMLFRLVRRPLYALTIETAGTQYTALSSYDRNAIHMLENEVVAAIENPPERERILQINNVVKGNQYLQGGSNNTMNVPQR